MAFRIQVTDPVKDKISILEVDSTLTVIDLKALIEVEVNLPIYDKVSNSCCQIDFELCRKNII